MADKPNEYPQNPKYDPNKYLVCGQVLSGQNLVSLLDKVSMPIGRRYVDASILRCLLTTAIDSRTKTSVLSMDRWPDCDMIPLDAVLVREMALAAVGANANDLGFIEDIMSEVDDAIEAGDTSGMGFFALLEKSLDPEHWPRQGTSERVLIDSVTQISLDIAKSIVSIIKKSVPAAERYGDDVMTILLAFIDLIRLLGDFMAEYRAVWFEQTKRWYSVQRKDNIAARYEAMYGSKPSSATIRAWCKYGATRVDSSGQSNPDGGLAPDGTSSAYEIALAEWNAKQQVADALATTLQKQFGSNLAKFFGVNTILAGWYGGYAGLRYHGTGDSAMTYSESLSNAPTTGFWDGLGNGLAVAYSGGLAYYFMNMRGTIEAGARNNQWKGNVLVWAYDGPNNDEENAVVIAVEKTTAPVFGTVRTRYLIPFWEDTYSANFKQPRNTGNDAPTRIRLKGNAAVELERHFNNLKINDFARDVLPVWLMWDFIAQKRNPGRGKRKRERWIASTLTTLADTFLKAEESFSSYAPSEITLDVWKQAIRTAVGADVPPPNKKSAKYGGVVGPCPPDGKNTNCLPCDFIKSRRPVGARAIDVALTLTWTGTRGPYLSPEYLAWKKALSDAGYPGYYIDCLTRDLVFKAGANAVDPSTPQPVIPGTTVAVPATRCPAGTILVGGRCFKPTGISGLPQTILRGITRPVVVELAGPTLPKRR
jgi:hypothetical protein